MPQIIICAMFCVVRTMSDATYLTPMAVRRRMQCSGQVAAIIEETFVTVEQLVEAAESDDPLTDIDGIGPTTADTIESWWDNRFEREREVNNAEFVRTGAKTATIYNLGDWSDALGEGENDE